MSASGTKAPKEQAGRLALAGLKWIRVLALDRIMEAVSTGEISTDQAAKLSGIIETKRKAIETVEFDRRLAELEAKKGGGQ